MQLIKALALFQATFINAMSIDSSFENIWLTLPKTPKLPQVESISEMQNINGVDLWSRQFNKNEDKTPIVLVHGGLGYSDYFGDVITKLVKHGHYVIAVDRRGHGKSKFNENDIFTYELFADDIDKQLKSLGVKEYYAVGWSDGAATFIAALQDSNLKTSIKKAFLFAGFMVPTDTNPQFEKSDIFKDFVLRCTKEYAENHPEDPSKFALFAKKVDTMERNLPQFTEEGLKAIDGSKVAIVEAEYDEAVKREVPEKLHQAIKDSQLITLKKVSHFAPMQDSVSFTQEIETFFFKDLLV
ncbi:hypothetical protein CROQUDRAFT_90302 [Cronartium quercuum f. sp. fusiforme G11]|uniref:AB hydrolase-1 domain-containing protein n=1 Tax=Cronartium quercuum f. sp. fusiforme G11 TaxID=708437 RepID=A0A9P6TE22_9BASI|nr:hypothetical protein CROQUDRAFT_90302 [Cronartium quercuum f. sp. fusiforme G11]